MTGRTPPTLDPDDGVPLHRQLTALLRNQIINHALPPGSQLPTEAQLQQQFGVSRSVVRQALASLASEDLIQRGRGRGSVVAPRSEHHRLVQRITGLSTQAAAEGVKMSTTILALAPNPAPRAVAVLGGSEALSLLRLRSVHDEPIALIRTWLPLPLCASLTADELTDRSLHAVLAEKYAIRLVFGRRHVRAVSGDPEVAAHLGIPLTSPVLLLEGTSIDANGRPIEVFSTWHRADRVIFDIDVIST